MAALTLGSELAYYLTINPNNPPQGSVTTASSSQIVLDYTDATRISIAGTGFAYDSFGEPVAGTVTGFQITHGGALAFSLSSISVSVNTLADYGESLDVMPLLQQMLSGADTITIQTPVAAMISGYDGNDTMQGWSGWDYLHGNQGDDVIDGGSGGGDWLVGGKGADRITAHGGDGVLHGNIGADTLTGGSGAEVIRGGQDSDVLRGNGGNDWLSGDRGMDTVSGGAGADVFHFFGGAGVDRVTDFNLAEGDRVLLFQGQAYTSAQVGADTVVDLGNGDQLVLAGVTQASLGTGWLVMV